MGRTEARLDADTPYRDGLIPMVPGIDIVGVTAGGSIVRIAAGEFSLRYSNTAGAVVVLARPHVLLRTGVQDDLQEFFGSARAGGAQGNPVAATSTLSTASTVAGANVSIPVLSSANFAVGSYVTIDTVASGVQEFTQVNAIPDGTHIQVAALANAHATPFPITQNLFTTPAGVSGRPGFSGQSELTPVTAPRPKGVMPKQLNVSYLITGVSGITVPTIGMFATQYQNGVAVGVTPLIAQATNGLQTAASATPYVTPVAVPAANRNFIITPNTFIVIEMDFTEAGATSQIDILGMALVCDYNYN